MVWDLLVRILIKILIIIISAIPLYLAVKLLRGKTTLMKVIIVNFLVAVAAFLIELIVSLGWLGSLLTAVALLFIYKSMFKIGWVRSILVWLLQIVIAALLMMLFALFGVALVLF